MGETGTMNASTFDTLAAAETLEAAGIDREHAKAIAIVIRNGQGDFATKTDLHAATAEIHTAIAGLETRIVERENRLVKWAVALAGAVVIILGVLIRWP